MKTNGINYTKDLIISYCEENGYNRKMIEKMYNFYVRKLTKKIKKQADTIEAPIKGLGIFFSPISGVNIAISKHKRKNEERHVLFFRKRKESILKRIQQCRDVGVRNIRFLYALISPRLIKNSGEK